MTEFHAETPEELARWERDDEAEDLAHNPDALSIDIDAYGASRSKDWNRGFADGLLFAAGCGPYSDGSWRSSHPQVARNRNEDGQAS